MRRSDRRRNTKEDTAIQRLLRWLWVPFSWIGSFHIQLLKYVGRRIKANPTKFATAFALIFFFSGVAYVFISIHKKNEQKLPEFVTIHAESAELNAKVGRATMRVLQDARKNKWSRKKMLLVLADHLKTIPSVDEAILRTGLDGHLQISAKEQIPLMVFYFDSQKVVISQKFRIMGKADNIETERFDVTHIKFPDFHSNKLLMSSLNIPWFYRSTYRIGSTLKSNGIKILNKEYTWRNGSGFSVTLESGPSVTLGESISNKQVARLKSILSDLDSKNSKASVIDLNFEDKAVIKLLDTASSHPANL